MVDRTYWHAKAAYQVNGVLGLVVGSAARLIAVGAIIGLVAAAAPAWRASRIDPAVALRNQ